MYDKMYDLDKGKSVNIKPGRGSGLSHSYYDYPIETGDALNNKIISSHIKNKTVIVTRPKTEKKRIALSLLDNKGNPVMQDGNYVIYKIKNMDVLVGLEKREFEFPIPDWFNDSTTSSILEKEEGQIIREIDDLSMSLFTEMLNNPKMDHSEFIAWLYWVKGSIVDTAKGIGGGAVEKAKTTITKGESLVREYRTDPNQFSEKGARKKKGLLGLGMWGL